VKKQRGDNLEETENAKPNEVMPNTIEADKNKGFSLIGIGQNIMESK
jgi:hypothetical protein